MSHPKRTCAEPTPFGDLVPGETVRYQTESMNDEREARIEACGLDWIEVQGGRRLGSTDYIVRTGGPVLAPPSRNYGRRRCRGCGHHYTVRSSMHRECWRCTSGAKLRSKISRGVRATGRALRKDTDAQVWRAVDARRRYPKRRPTPTKTPAPVRAQQAAQPPTPVEPRLVEDRSGAGQILTMIEALCALLEARAREVAVHLGDAAQQLAKDVAAAERILAVMEGEDGD